MKSLLWLAILLTPNLAFAKAEIQIFMDYKGYNDYAEKIVSTTEMPVSAWYLLEDSNHSAACYKGDQLEAIQLMQTMMQIYNAEYNQNASVSGSPSVNKSARPGLTFNLSYMGQDYTWFSFMRECIRWSTPSERSP